MILLFAGASSMLSAIQAARPVSMRRLHQDDCLSKVDMAFMVVKDACDDAETICSECLGSIAKEIFDSAPVSELESTFPFFYKDGSWNKAQLQKCAMPYAADFMANDVFGSISDAMAMLSCTDEDFATSIETSFCARPDLGPWFTEVITCPETATDTADSPETEEPAGEEDEDDSGDDPADDAEDLSAEETAAEETAEETEGTEEEDASGDKPADEAEEASAVDDSADETADEEKDQNGE